MFYVLNCFGQDSDSSNCNQMSGYNVTVKQDNSVRTSDVVSASKVTFDKLKPWTITYVEVKAWNNEQLFSVNSTNITTRESGMSLRSKNAYCTSYYKLSAQRMFLMSSCYF